MEIIQIRLNEVLKEDLLPRIRYQLENNPHNDGENHFAKTVALIDGILAGWTYVYPTKLKMGDSIVSVGTGTSFFVKEEYRRDLIGLFIPEYGVKHSRNGISVGAGYSKDAQPIFRKYLKYTYFPMPRYIYLRHTRVLLDNKVKGWFKKFIAACCDLFLDIVHGLHSGVNLFRYRGVVVEEAKDEVTIKQVSEIIMSDDHRYQELHDIAWIQWVLNAYHDDPRYGQHLYVVKQNKKVVAFWITKIRYYKNLHNKYHNLSLGYIMEWGTVGKVSEADICAMAIHHFPEYVDGIILSSSNSGFVRKTPVVRKKMGETNFMIHIRKDFREKYPGYSDIDNWRIRPGMCDAFFD